MYHTCRKRFPVYGLAQNNWLATGNQIVGFQNVEGFIF